MQCLALAAPTELFSVVKGQKNNAVTSSFLALLDELKERSATKSSIDQKLHALYNTVSAVQYAGINFGDGNQHDNNEFLNLLLEDSALNSGFCFSATDVFTCDCGAKTQGNAIPYSVLKLQFPASSLDSEFTLEELVTIWKVPTPVE